MVVEVGLIEQRKMKRKNKKTCKKKKVKKPIQEASSMALQRLFETCREVFEGPESIPSPSDVQKICHVLDGMVPEDVGLSPNLQFFQPKSTGEGNPTVTNATIYTCENFSLSIFFLPATGIIPLHNHPGMTVFGKLLLGTMHIKAYDWVDRPDNAKNSESSTAVRLASLKVHETFRAPCTSVLYPTSGGNIHEFRAVTPCVVLDVMGPPYSKDDGRDCSYYRDAPFSAFSNGEEFPEANNDGVVYGWLEEIEMPKDSEMDVVQYKGPQVI